MIDNYIQSLSSSDIKETLRNLLDGDYITRRTDYGVNDNTILELSKDKYLVVPN